MKHISELQNTLADFLDWNKARLECLVQILQALFVVRTVNLVQVATAFQTDASEESSYRRVRRFFSEFAFDLSLIVTLVLHLFPLGDKYLLILDRTNWKWGKSPINILTLSVAYLGISIPLFWIVLDLEGSSCTADRISILKRVINRLGVDKIEALLADREFIGNEWFNFLIADKIPFVIRVKQNTTVNIDGSRKLRVGNLCKLLGRKRLAGYPVWLWGNSLYVSVGRKRGAKEPMIVVSGFYTDKALAMYRRRWEIETMFGCLKTKGFRMEDTHITDADKIEKLMFVLAIAFCWAYRNGDLLAIENPIKLKAHGRKAKSLFRVGLDCIRRQLFRKGSIVEFRKILECFG